MKYTNSRGKNPEQHLGTSAVYLEPLKQTQANMIIKQECKSMIFQRQETMIYKMRLNLKGKNSRCINNLGYTRLTMQKHEKSVIILSSAEKQARPIPLQKCIALNKHIIIISPTKEQLEILTSAELKTSGNKKLRSDQSSCKLF